MNVWAYEVCRCKYETGYAVHSLHETKELAEAAMKKYKKAHPIKRDGYRVVRWDVEKNAV